MDKLGEHTLLYDFYGPLLSEKKREIYEAVRFGDLSLSEASEQFDISRQGIHDCLRRVEKSLDEYEEKLGLVKQFRAVKDKAEQIREICQSFEANGNSRISLDRIMQLSKDIEEL